MPLPQENGWEAGGSDTAGAPILVIPLLLAPVAGTSSLGQQVDRVQNYAYSSLELKGAELQLLSLPSDSL